MNGVVEGHSVGNGEEDRKSDESSWQPRLTRQVREQPAFTAERPKNKEGGIAVVFPQNSQKLEVTPSGEEKIEVIKVYLEPRLGTSESVRMLTDEVTQIQEVRYCLKTLREQMAARQNSNNNNKFPANGLRLNMPEGQSAVFTDTVICDSYHKEGKVLPSYSADWNKLSHYTAGSVENNQEESTSLREATQRLYVQLKDMEKQHQEEKDRLQAESKEFRLRLAQQSKQLQQLEEESKQKDQQVEELQTLLRSVKAENGVLREKTAEREAELQRKAESQEERRCEVLEKAVSVLKEKNHHLDDMLKSQQRKVRNMIEQVQNSRTELQGRDQVIRDLEERVAFLEAENRELHDHMEYFLSDQEPPTMSTPTKPEVVYSKPLTPTTQTSKPLPFIKVIEIKS